MIEVNVDELIDFEAGNLSQQQLVSLFARLIRSGLAFQLQGNYGRTAQGLIDGGLISPEGEILTDKEGDDD